MPLACIGQGQYAIEHLSTRYKVLGDRVSAKRVDRNGCGYVDLDAVDQVDEVDEAIEIDLSIVVNRNADGLLHCLHRQIGPASWYIVEFTKIIGRIDLVG